MAATIHQGAVPAGLRIPEVNSLTFSYDIRAHATKSMILTPREKIDLKWTLLTVPESQGRKKAYKWGFVITAKILETDPVAFQQLLYYSQSPCQAWLQMAQGEVYSFIANATTNAAQLQGGATGTSLGSVAWEFVDDEKERYFNVTFSGEMSLVEKRFCEVSSAVALVGTATTELSKGVLAHMTNGEASYRIPGFISVAITNTGGAAVGGILGETVKLTLKTEGTKVKDGLVYAQMVVVSSEIHFKGYSQNDALAFCDDLLENVTYIFNDRNGCTFTFLNVATPTPEMVAGDGIDNYAIIIRLDGHAVMSPDDSATPPLNINPFVTVATDFKMTLVNN
jgi:hypothetical protein